MNVIPCQEHGALMSPSLPWHRVLQAAEDCPRCVVTEEEP